MPIMGQGWEFHVMRQREDVRGNSVRTVARYQVFLDGTPVPALAGAIAETRGPSDNSVIGKNRVRVAAGRYPLWTQYGTKYRTLAYSPGTSVKDLPRPGIELKDTGERDEILIHPAQGFRWSIGCLNPCRSLADAKANIEFADSRARTIALIEHLRTVRGAAFPAVDGRRIPDAWAVIDGEP